MEVVVVYEYAAQHEDELTLRLGEVIRSVCRVEEEGWLEGELSGRRGLFPDNFVKEVKREEVKEEAVRREKSGAGNVANLVQRMSTYGLPAGAFQPSSQPRTPRKKPKQRQCRVLFEYVPQNEDELELKVGDIVDVTEEVEEGWWSGCSARGKSGLFPSNFVKEVETGEDGEMNDLTDETEGGGRETLAPPTSPQPPGGEAQPKKVRGVGFGDIFREGSVKLKVRLPSADTDERKDKPIPSLPSAAKPTHSASQRDDGDSRAKVRELCKATFAFEATNDDELTLVEGDIIHILSKDTGEPGWWRGEIGGKEGVFPDNFVALLSDAEKETSTPRGSVKLPPKPDSEERPKKPPPPSKNTGDKTVPDPKAKPSAPVVPPKKPLAPPGKGRPGSLPPKRPDKPLAPSPGAKHNGEVPSQRPKSDFEPTLPSKPNTLSADWGEKALDMDLLGFRDLSPGSEKLSHPTASRPKMPGRRLPAHLGAHSPNKDVSPEKSFLVEEDDSAKPTLPDSRKPMVSTSMPALYQSSVLKHNPSSTGAVSESKPCAPSAPSSIPAFTSAPAATPAPGPGPRADPAPAPGPGPRADPAPAPGPGPRAEPAPAPGPGPRADPAPGPGPGPRADPAPGPGPGPRADPAPGPGPGPRAEPAEQGPLLEDLRAQIKDLLLSVELLKTQQMREIAELRGELDEEKLKRVALQMEVEKLKRMVQST
ncbi:CD2-associated protein isoform X2 [Osmerus mordax]|uniref:CD2-associated protein isoform X2 n=1 Tax=Osmerus mordax TaxID=8014 RepID=UPI003510CDE0